MMAFMIFAVIATTGVILVIKWAIKAYRAADIEEKVQLQLEHSELIQTEAEKINRFRKGRGKEEEDKNRDTLKEFIQQPGIDLTDNKEVCENPQQQKQVTVDPVVNLTRLNTIINAKFNQKRTKGDGGNKVSNSS